MRFKVGVKLEGLKPQTVLAMGIVDGIYQKIAGHEMVITSVNDSQHMTTSKHYSGEAFDVRTRDLGLNEEPLIVTEAKARLAAFGFDVVQERDHLHVEWDPKG